MGRIAASWEKRAESREWQSSALRPFTETCRPKCELVDGITRNAVAACLCVRRHFSFVCRGGGAGNSRRKRVEARQSALCTSCETKRRDCWTPKSDSRPG